MKIRIFAPQDYRAQFIGRWPIIAESSRNIAEGIKGWNFQTVLARNLTSLSRDFGCCAPEGGRDGV